MAARKSLAFLQSVIAVTKTHDEVVKEKFKPGKYVFTVAANIKIAAVIILLACLAITISSDYCVENVIYRYLIGIVSGLTLIIVFCLYVIFSSGVVVQRTTTWVKIDIITNLILALLTIISCSLCMNMCLINSTIRKVPGPLGLTGGALLISSCAALFLLYRYREDEVVESLPRPMQPRKSIFA
ncbi:PREDICTED: uncharacterized protein LOC108564377 [Nicrophorus vespilloides]|uniref:Uncharacterized protein LOC108564377 n=1 Tax=Nicrophorus vespilloides TaxID=110193 RepID=A0ABM1MWE3_NICVS|nr:PREDICTED: uncharacterized protein LOC108564377 [Nicrophorus vespilloides]